MTVRRYWASVVGWLVLAFGLLELAARLFVGVPVGLRFDRSYDQTAEPDRLAVQSTEGFSRDRTNELGNFDEPMPVPLPANGVLVIGDSYTEGRQVATAERYSNLVAGKLHRRVYNVGHAGWSPINALAYLSGELSSFDPATVVVQVSGNDLKDVVATKTPHIVKGAGGLSIVLPDRERHGIGKRITQIREAVSRSAIVGDLIGAALAAFTKGGGDDAAGAGDYCDHPDPVAVSGVDWIVGQLASTHPDVRILYLPSIDYHHGCVDRCAAARHVFEQAASRNSLRFVDVSAAVCRRFVETGQPLNGFSNTVPGTGHFNQSGHEVIASELVRELTDHPSANLRSIP